MHTTLLTLALLFAAVSPGVVQAEQELPTVIETCDEVMVLTAKNGYYPRVLFIKDGQIFASRMLQDDMIWSSQGNKLVLIWEDYSLCNRVVKFKYYSNVYAEYDPTSGDRQGAWWAMNRNMRDLKQP
jgi:hypothetical protein